MHLGKGNASPTSFKSYKMKKDILAAFALRAYLLLSL